MNKLITQGGAFAVALGLSFNVLGDDSKNGNAVSITPFVKNEGKTNAWRNLAAEVADNQKRMDAQTAQDSNTSLLSPLLKGVTYEAGACLVDCGEQPCAPEKKGGFFGNVEYLSLTPFQSNNTIYHREIDDNNADHRQWDLESRGSHRYEVGYRSSPSCLGFRARYWHFDESFNDRTDTGGIDSGFATWADDVYITAADGGTVEFYDAVETIDVQVLDIEAMRQIGCGTDLSFGVRWATFNQGYNGSNGTDTAQSVMNFEGTGPTIAISTEQNVAPCLFLYGGLRGSLLFGEQLHSAASSDNTGYNYQANNDSALATSLDADIGLGYRRGCFNISGGMEAQYWMDVGSANPSGYSTDGDGASDQTGEDVGFIGWKIGAGFDF